MGRSKNFVTWIQLTILSSSLWLLLMFSIAALAGQSVVGSIAGTVTDPTGATIPGTDVTLMNLGTNERRQVRADEQGNYRFLNLLPGNYVVTVEKEGFKTLTRQPITLEVQSNLRIDLQMALGETSQTVEIVAATPLLQTQESSLAHVVESRSVQDLPLNGRNVLNLITLVPGVVPQGNTAGNPATANVNGWGNYQIGGGTANQSATYIDGAPINVSYVNGTSLVPTQDAIQEFRVATNNISPEFGRFAGGIVNMSTKSGTNAYHGTFYEFFRNRSLNANNFFSNRVGSPRPAFNQNQFGVTLSGPAVRDKTFVFLSYEGFILRQGTVAINTVPTAAMRKGDFSAPGIPLIYDPATTRNANGEITRLPFSGNQIPPNRLDPAAVALSDMLWPLPNQPGLVNNFQITYNRSFNYNQYTGRVDHRIGDRHALFGRYTFWKKGHTQNAPLQNQTGTGNRFASIQTVLGYTYTIDPTTFLDVRASFLRFTNRTLPLTCCNFDLSKIGPGWTPYQKQVTFSMLPQPRVTGMFNFNTIPVILNTDNAYTLSASLNKVVGHHTLKLGGEFRRIEWYYAQTNSATGTFDFDSGFTSRLPLAAGNAPGSPQNTGYGFASWLLGLPASGSTQQPALSAAYQYYQGLYVSDTFQVNNKLTLNLGLRWEQPGSFAERHGSLTTLDLAVPQPALSQALGRTVTGGLALVESDGYSPKTWQRLHWKLFSPRAGFAYSFDGKTVLRGGYGIAYPPNVVAFSLGPYNSPVNSAVTSMVATLDGGLTPNPRANLSNPFPDGIAAPPGRSQPYLNSLLGQGIQSPLPDQPYPYMQQWNLDLQRELGSGLLVDVGYAGSRGVHLPLYSVNLDQIPNQYLSMGSGLLTQVPNPFYGTILQSAGILGQPTIAQGYLLKPYPQYLWVTADSPSIGDSFYRALQTKVQKRFGSGGVLTGSYTWSHFEGTADVLSPWLEADRFGVGGAYGIQDNNNINPGERSLSSFDLPHRLVISYVVDLPFGRNRRFLSNAGGIKGGLVSGWSFNGVSTFQSGFPLAFITANQNTLVKNFAAGFAGPGTGAGTTRPNFVAGCNPVFPGTETQRIQRYFNTSCYTIPGPFEFGNEPRVSPLLRAQGIANFDFAVSKKTAVTERFNLEFRSEFFNLMNRKQLGPPNTQVGAAQFGQVTTQINLPRLVQFGLRLGF